MKHAKQKPAGRPRFVPVYFGNRFAIEGDHGLLRDGRRVRTYETLEEAYRAAAYRCGLPFERFLDLMEPVVGRQSFDPRDQAPTKGGVS